MDAAIERVRAYQETGVDAIFVPGVQKRKDLEKIRKNISLPAVLVAACAWGWNRSPGSHPAV
jgi:2-methylisocitrate lyase-like PEP mutase family enzyme